ncbi:hypothetical protein [Microscilla marina]|uniref:DUF4890 domain-containing protein n=1 Tax=Microscilla marina ATCC 23134 TaxID=313606 RepID=A1ZE01_MICM2|nr:hypothetical protein [Microscilla marina]EAY31309.1 conserved hypothetical protein [Microscilla marina ATCC 23134]
MRATLANITRFSVLSLLMVLLVNASYAQNGKRADWTPEQRAEKVAKNLTKKLELNADQTTKLQAANLTWQKARDAAKASNDRKALRTARKAYRAELSTILTSEQQTKLKALQDARKAKRKGGGK